MPRGGDVDMGVSSCIGADAAVRGATVPGYGDDIANASRAPWGCPCCSRWWCCWVVLRRAQSFPPVAVLRLKEWSLGQTHLPNVV